MATEKPQAGEEIPSQNGGSDNGAEGRQIVVDLNDNDVLYTRGYVCHGYRCFQNVVEEFRGKAAKAKKIRDVAREALAAFEARYPTSRFVTKTRKNDYVLTERKRIIAKFAYAFNYAKDDEPDDVFGGLQDGAAIAALAELQPSKRNRRPSKRMAEFNEATAKKGKKRRKRSKDHNTSGFLSIENHQHSSVAEPKPEPRGLGELALKFMRWAFVSQHCFVSKLVNHIKVFAHLSSSIPARLFVTDVKVRRTRSRNCSRVLESTEGTYSRSSRYLGGSRPT